MKRPKPTKSSQYREWISNIPAYIPIEKLENEGFKNFLSKYCRRKVPCANTIRKLVPKIFQKLKILRFRGFRNKNNFRKWMK